MIDKIRGLFVYLPQKDINLANEFLNKRDFLNLKDLVDSDVVKVYKILEGLLPEEADGIITDECLKMQSIYNALKDLQHLVDIQASAFEIDIDEYYTPLED